MKKMTTNKVNEQVMDKIAKLLRLANCKGASEGEVANAMAAAAALGRRHDIDIASVNLEDKKNGKVGVEVEHDTSLTTSSRYEQPYHRWVYHILKEVFNVRIVRDGDKVQGQMKIHCIHIFGTPTDVAIARAVFPFLQKTFPRILTNYVTAGVLKYNAADTNGCYRGIAIGILEANKREEEKMEEADSATWAMVVAGKKEAIELAVVKVFGGGLKTSKSRTRKNNVRAIELGYEKGRQINLKQLSK